MLVIFIGLVFEDLLEGGGFGWCLLFAIIFGVVEVLLGEVLDFVAELNLANGGEIWGLRLRFREETNPGIFGEHGGGGYWCLEMIKYLF